MHSFRYNSQIKCFWTHVDMDIFSCFGMWNSCPKFVRTFQLHPVCVYISKFNISKILKQYFIPTINIHLPYEDDVIYFQRNINTPINIPLAKEYLTFPSTHPHMAPSPVGQGCLFACQTHRINYLVI
jgi:hypothetical protein